MITTGEYVYLHPPGWAIEWGMPGRVLQYPADGHPEHAVVQWHDTDSGWAGRYPVPVGELHIATGMERVDAAEALGAVA